MSAPYLDGGPGLTSTTHACTFTPPSYARCPLCGRSVPLWRDHTGRQVYVVHGPDVINGDQCEASVWIAEDDELVGVRPRKTRSDAGRAQPSRRTATNPI